MEKRSCGNCAYATRLWGRWLRIIMAGWSGLRVCFNSTQSPGRLQEVYPTASCRNWRPKPTERHHARPKSRASNAPRPKKETRLIPLTHGLHAMVDAADYEWLSRYKWYLWGEGYAARRVPGGMIFMHREIMKAPPGKDVDHFNGNRLDNHRSNLRLCTRAQNLRNMAKRQGCLSQYKGVSRDRRHNKWFATVWFDGRSISLGHFDDEAEAARAYDRAALKLFREYAWLNFPEEIDARRKEIAGPDYRKMIAKFRRKNPAKRQAARAKAKPASRKSRPATPRRKPDKRKKNRSTTKVTRKRRVRLARRSS